MSARTLAVLLLLILGGCPGNSGLRLDGRVITDGSSADGPVYPDTKITLVDFKGWPDKQGDTKKTPDLWPWATDSYVGTPFGCTTDSDCFGQLCCATPWGVKLCASSCDHLTP